jgi:hypothetical protein
MSHDGSELDFFPSCSQARVLLIIFLHIKNKYIFLKWSKKKFIPKQFIKKSIIEKKKTQRCG